MTRSRGNGTGCAGPVALWPVEALERLDPRAHLALEVRGADRLRAVGVFQGAGEQHEPLGRRVRIGGPDAFLLRGDDVRLPLVDRQPASGLANLGHVVDEHGTGPPLAVVANVDVIVQAGEAKGAQLGGASADPGTEFDRGADRLAGEGLQEGEAVRREQLRHHDIGERVADGVIGPRAAGALTGTDGDVAGEPGQHPARLGQAHLPAVSEKPRDEMDRRLASRLGELAGAFEVAQTCEEGLDVEAAERSGVGALVGAPGQVL